MKKTVTILIVIIFLLLVGAAFLLGKSTPTASPLSMNVSPTIEQTTPTQVMQESTVTPGISYCAPQDLKAGLTLSPGAGNVYGTASIKNTSSKTCNVVGNNYISANYDTKTITNITVIHQGQVEKELFVLSPGQTLYSQVHYPNGPQCQAPTKSAAFSFSYAVSPQSTITFVNENNTKTEQVMVCQSSEKTTIDIWNISARPITPQ